MYRVYLFSSLNKEVITDFSQNITCLQILIEYTVSHDISAYIEGCIGGIDENMIVEEIIQGTDLEKTLEIESTVLVDVNKFPWC